MMKAYLNPAAEIHATRRNSLPICNFVFSRWAEYAKARKLRVLFSPNCEITIRGS